jgi:hypothetical protein
MSYEELTETEAENWLKSITMDELIDFVIKYDYVEHIKPEIVLPEYRVIETDRLILDPAGKMNIKIGHLEYDVELPEKSVEWNQRERSCVGPIFIAGGIGLGVGVIGGLILGAIIK